MDGAVPPGIAVKQVHGLIFTRDGRLLLRRDGEHYSLAGGKPEPDDGGLEGTLRKELLEEVNIEIEPPVLIGYQLVDEQNGSHPYAQVRMAAFLKNVGPSRPDPATGRTYERLWVPPSRAVSLLDWGQVREQQIQSAVEIVRERLQSSQFSNERAVL